MPPSDAGISVRPAGPEDAPGIAHVHIDSWRTTYRGIVPDAHLDSMNLAQRTVRWHENLTEEAEKGWFTLVAAEAERIVGFAGAGPVRGNEPCYTGELGGIYLIESHQRRGIGRRLVAEVARRLQDRGMDSMLLWVLRDNPSRRFYEALGGVYVREQVITIGGADLVEVAYGWKDTFVLL